MRLFFCQQVIALDRVAMIGIVFFSFIKQTTDFLD